MTHRESIREFAREHGHSIVGKLTYIREIDHERMYLDEGNNEYWRHIRTGAICIVTADGAVI